MQHVNEFYGNDLRLAPGTLYIPITAKARALGWKAQNVEKLALGLFLLGGSCNLGPHAKGIGGLVLVLASYGGRLLILLLLVLFRVLVGSANYNP